MPQVQKKGKNYKHEIQLCGALFKKIVSVRWWLFPSDRLRYEYTCMKSMNRCGNVLKYISLLGQVALVGLKLQLPPQIS